MYRLSKFRDHKPYRNGDINSYINSYVNTLEKAELTASIRHIAMFLKSEIPIYNFEVRDTGGRKTRKRRRRVRRTQEIAKRYAFHANALSKQTILVTIRRG